MLFAFVNRLFADPLLLFGVISGVLSVYAFVPYIADTIARRTRPERASWLIWSVLGSIALASQIAEGAGASLWFAVVQVSGTVIVFLLSIKRGHGAYMCKRNRIILPIAAAGLVLWYLTDTPIIALAVSISISLMAGSVTIWKAFRDPDSETLITWLVALAASWFAVLSVGSLNWWMLAYPLYLLVLYTGIVAAITIGRATGQTPYRETFVWRSRRAQQSYVMPPPAYPPVPLVKAA